MESKTLDLLYLSHQQGQSSDGLLQRSDFSFRTDDEGGSRVDNRLATTFADSQLFPNSNSTGGGTKKTVSPLMNPDKLPLPYRIENAVPFLANVLDFFEL
ncbi:hypothetical protein F7725_003783 [Dissostichus mawsoni]|uniref:Uncharacterized protein n=1 Tax=Dissostichus mawsoni TaxID=36200 RepID=A0A7J5YBB1_DISMA|nr:hypothetical protein F7725_003783 [Dissostichus mawsoni]